MISHLLSNLSQLYNKLILTLSEIFQLIMLLSLFYFVLYFVFVFIILVLCKRWLATTL